MTTQPSNGEAIDNLEAIDDSELANVNGGVKIDGKEVGQNVKISGNQNKKFNQIDVGPGDTFSIG